MPAPGHVFRLTAIVTAAACAVPAWSASHAEAPSGTALAVCAAFVPYALLLVLDVPERSRTWLACLVPGVALALAPSVLSDDVYRYAWDARVWLEGGVDPYAHAPDAAALVELRDASYARVNHRDIPTIYPPLAQLLFALARLVWPGATGLKLLALVFHLLTAVLVSRLALYARGERAATRAVHLYALNPLALAESALGGHVDVAVGATVCALALALTRARPWLAALAIGALSGLKLVGLALWPALLRRGVGPLLLALALGLLALWPTVRAGYADDGASAPGVSHYAQRWRGNAGAFRLFEACGAGLVRALPEAAEPQELGPDEVRLGALAPLLRRLDALGFHPSRSLRAEKKQARPPDVFDRAHLASLIGKALALTCVVALGVLLALRRTPPVRALRNVLWAVLLLAPQVHPWYLLWLLSLDLAAGSMAAVAWSAVACVAYAPLDAWIRSRLWDEHALALAGQYTLVATALALAWLAGRANHSDRHVSQR